MELWGRQLKFTAGDRVFDGNEFTINYSVPFSTNEDPDISEIEIYNLTDSSISAIKTKAYAILNAGYKNDVGNIMLGKIETIDTRWGGVDKITTIKVSDGAVEWRKASVSKTYKANTKADYIMKDLASLLGLEVLEISPKVNVVYKRGKTISGSVEKALKQLADDTKSKMYINKGKLYIRASHKGTETGFLLNSDSGLLGSPEMVIEEIDEKEVVKYNVECLLNHRITTDSIIQIDSRMLKGRFRVEEGEHSDFITTMKVVPA